MGHLPERHNKREMYFHLLLLISTAFGMPSPDLISKGEDIIKQLDSLPGFTEDTKDIFKNVMSELYENVTGSLLEAEKNVLKLNVELKLFKTEEVKFKEDYFPAYNEAQRYLRESRQKLRKLADRTVKEVKALKVLLKDVDESEDPVLLKFSLEKMKALMIETLKTLKQALEKYNSARETIQNVNSSINEKNIFLKKMVNNNTTEYKNWTTDLRVAINGKIGEMTTACKIADYLGALRICSAISDAISGLVAGATEDGATEDGATEDGTTEDNAKEDGATEDGATEDGATEAAAEEAAITEAKIGEYTKMLENFIAITERMMKSGEDFDITIEDAISTLTDEIERISSWTRSTEFGNIDKHPKEYLENYISIRTNFVSGLDDLKNSAEEFLARPLEIL